MRLSVSVLLFYCLLPVMGNATDVSAFLDTVRLRRYETDMHSMTRIKVNPSDSIYVAKFKETRYFNTDTLFHYLATQGYKKTEDELYYYFYDIVAYMSAEQAAGEVKKVVELARRYKNHDVVSESEFLPLFVALASDDSTRFHDTMDKIYLLAQKEAAQKDIRREINYLRFIFNVSYINGYYARGFRFARLTADRLDEVTDEEYPDRKATYYMIGNAYHAFRDYHRSIPYLKAALRNDGSLHMADRANLRARRNLGEYYASTGDLEQSDAYFLSMWNSPDQVKRRPFYDIIALTGLAENEMKRGNYDTPLRIFNLCLPALEKENALSQINRVRLHIAECFLAKGQLPAIREILDSSRSMLKGTGDENAQHYYKLENLYYSRKGDADKARCYLDSTLTAYRTHENKYNTLVILRAEQELFETEKALDKQQMEQQVIFTRLSIAATLLLVIILIFIFRLYKKERTAYHQLVLRTQEWAKEIKVAIPKPNEAETDDLALMAAINKLVEDEKIYRDAELNTESLAARLGVNRNAISKAVNSTQHKKFNAFINDYRIREAIRLLSDPANDKLTADAIAADAGFNSRETFFRTFKAYTGITPSQFRKNRT